MTERAALKSIARLYVAALQLPPPWNESLPVEVPDVDLPKPHVDAVQTRASELQRQIYWVVFDPYQEPPESPVIGHLTDDLGDIYRDISRGLILFDGGRVDEALWEWAFNFRIHWGKHATSAMRALHASLSQENPDALSSDA